MVRGLLYSGTGRALLNINTARETTMSQQTRIIKSNNDEVPQEIAELAEAIAQLPPQFREKIDPSLARVIDTIKRRRRILSLVQDALSQLRLDMKYLAFDLEATRRERDEYRRKSEDAS
jgi:hypothetical protein